WPALQVDTIIEGGDELVHAAVFGILAMIVWRAGWFASPARFLAGALAWAFLDEALQGVEWVRRHAVDGDFIADAAGIVAGWGVIRASRAARTCRESPRDPARTLARRAAAGFAGATGAMAAALLVAHIAVWLQVFHTAPWGAPRVLVVAIALASAPVAALLRRRA
ncbi:MAG: hypothetical protein O2819_00670, partial [Planctomycetota bacterium]|nr:hypothetical protein [Planctomycetota bacterium]